MIRALRRGIQQAKREIEAWLLDKWARDTGRLVHSMMKFLRRNMFNDLKKVFIVALGSDVHYLPYVLKMIGVNWTNKQTKSIEGHMMESLIIECGKRFRKYIPLALDESGLGWMTGRGFLPKQFKTLTSRGNEKVIPGYKGHKRILQWVR